MYRSLCCLLAILAVMILVTFAPSAYASDTVTVCPKSFPATGAISAAVATAASDTTINVCPGTYYDNVTFHEKKVKVIGEGKSGAVVVQCSDPSGSAFYHEAYDDYVQNMEITGCAWGVFIDGSLGGTDGVIRDNIFVSNTVGVEAYQTTTATVQANTFTNNGTAILDNGSTSSDFGSNTIVGNCATCSNTFGISLEGASKASVKSNHISGVYEGVAVYGGTNGSTITENKVTSCYLAFFIDQAGNNTFTDNQADSSEDGFLASPTTGQGSLNGKPNVIDGGNKAQGNLLYDLQDQSSGTEPDGVGNKWHKNTCGSTGSSPASLCTD
ncbi:MAG: NosD domain-containing protein [Candidatus Korobacteraceae bacterium]